AGAQLKFSHAGPSTSTWQVGAEKFVELVKAGTNGKFNIAIFPLDELSGGSQVGGIELVQTGVTDIHLQDALVWSAVAKKSVVPCFPWLLPTYEDVDRYMQGEGGAALKQVLNEADVVCLAIGENGYRQVVNNRNPITSPEDMKGLKIRVPGSSVHVSLLKYIGADPLTMNQSEVYTSLQQGTIDACENTLDLLFTQKTLEVVKYLSLWNYSYDPLYLSVSKELWDSLSDEEKTVFQNAANEAMALQVKVTREKDQALRDQLGEYNLGVVPSLTPEQVQVFKEAVAPVYQDYKEEFGEDLFGKFGYTF
ncbi:MAG: DctP family TRAP transporter solute-binding subunit, partial [Fretibacterium sp.]|nr:DctP family TRAP transporter solute-binding subunit [Fretibacterium sp.]